MRNAFLGKVKLNQGKIQQGTFADVLAHFAHPVHLHFPAHLQMYRTFYKHTLSVLDILLMLLKAWSNVESKSSYYLLSANPKVLVMEFDVLQ